MAQNPYEAPQHVGGMTIPSVHVQYPWVEPTRSKITNVAKHQRWVNIHFLIAILGGILFAVVMQAAGQKPNELLTTVFLILLIPNVLCLIYRVYQLSSALGYSLPILVALASVLGIIGIIIVALLSSEANRYLKQFNIRVGFLGANPEKVEAMIQAAEHEAQGTSGLPVAQAWAAPPR